MFFLFISVTGLLLGWKKNSGGLLLPKSYKGTSTNLADWLPLDSLHKNACRIVQDSISPELSLELERIDVRKDKGMVKFVFADHFWGVQLDGATGKLLHIEQRRSDFIEKIHDGSILDFYAGTSDGQIKLVYTTITGLALLLFTVTGFWLWYGPKRMRQNAANR
ncbi:MULTISPECIES: PepSY domain-containing protein [Spirosoma]|uniref:PepSY domain-containing protein n=1 Tax=Spirosoma TaxID=107 RepID=UPI001F10B9B9